MDNNGVPREYQKAMNYYEPHSQELADFKHDYFALSMAIRSMSLQIIAARTDQQHREYIHDWQELVHRKDLLVLDWQQKNVGQGHWNAAMLSEVKEVKKEYEALETRSKYFTKEVHTGEWQSSEFFDKLEQL